jgi:hypothetical protein
MAGPKAYMLSDDLIASVKRRQMIPQNQNTFKDTDFLAFADEEMNLGLVPSLISQQEDYMLYTDTVPVATNQMRFAIPYRAIGNKLREVAYQDPSGNVYEMTRIGVGDLPYYNASSGYNRPYAYYIENNEIVLAPTTSPVSSNTFLRISYYIRPNSLVTVDKVGVITSIDRTTGLIQVSSLPKDFILTEKYDLIKLQSPNKTLKFDIVPVAINSTSKTITLNVADIPDSLSNGDHICIATQCAVPQIPSDLHVVLAHRVAARCLEALGDTEGLQAANTKLAEMESKMVTLTSDRVDDAPRKVVNRHSAIRAGLSRSRRGWRS